MKNLILILTMWFFIQEVKAQLRFDAFSEVIKSDINKANQPDTFFVFINPVPCAWGNEGDWSKLLVFAYRKGGIWHYHATKIDKRDRWLIKSVSNPCSFSSSLGSYFDLLFLEAHRSIVAISKEKKGEHTGFYVSLMAKCGEESVELPYYNAPGPGHIMGFLNGEFRVFYELFGLCLVNASGFDYKIEYRKKIKKTANLYRMKF